MKKSNQVMSMMMGVTFGAVLVLFASMNAFSSSKDGVTSSVVVADQSGVRVVGNSKIAHKSFATAEFDSVNIGGENDITITPGNHPAVVVTTDENILPYINVAVANKILNIGAKLNVEISPSQAEKIHITALPLHKINVHGNMVLKAINMNSDDLSLTMGGKSIGQVQGDIQKLQINLRGNSELHLNVKNAKTIDLKIFGKGTVDLSGKANDLNIMTGGNAKVEAKNLLANQVTIMGAGESEMIVHAINTLSIKTAGESHVQYYGNPQISKKSLGEATIENIR